MYHSILRQVTLILLLFPFFAQPGHGQTLYERSSAQLAAKSLQATPNDFTFVVLGDSRDGDAVFKQILRLAKSYDPLFILHGGDYSESGGEAETARFLSLVNQAVPGIPLFVVMGNHENPIVFARQIGPSNFTLESKRLGLTLVAVDNSVSVLKPAELDYLQSRLSQAARGAFVAMHVPSKTERWNWHIFTEGAVDLKKILAKYQVQGVFFSHVHAFDRMEIGGVPAFITGGAGGPLISFLTNYGFPGESVYHIVVVRVKNGKASYSMVPLPEQR